MSDGRGNDEEVRLRRKNRQALIDSLNASEERLLELEGRHPQLDKLHEDELAQEIERERQRNPFRFGSGQAGGFWNLY